LWALPASLVGSASERLIARLQKLQPHRRRELRELPSVLEAWLDASRGRSVGVPLALESLAWCQALPTLAHSLSSHMSQDLLEQLIETATEAGRVDLSADPLTQQLLAGELPLTLACQFPDVAACPSWSDGSMDLIAAGLKHLLDEEGFPHAEHWLIARSLFASWTRSGYLAQACQRPFPAETQSKYRRLVRQMLRLTRYDGGQVLRNGKADWSPSLFEAALALADEPTDDVLARRLLPGGKPTARVPETLPAPSVHSEWAQAALMRREWKRGSDQVAVTYHRSHFTLELNGGSNTLFSGVCNPGVQIDGRAVALDGEWEEVCWLSDSDVDYLELECQLAEGWRVQRQVALAREDRFLFLSDAVLGDVVAEIEHRTALPLASGVTFQSAEETREGWVGDARRRGLVLPLQLPEWRWVPASGTLEQQAGDVLELRQRVRGRRLFAPLFIDLEPRRFQRPLTWRQLTVAEQLHVVPADVAVGYRVQIGDRQWVVYRSLGPVGNRSVLGQNFSTEFVLGRFTAKGVTEKLVEIE